MSHTITRTTPDSPEETTEPKKKAIDPEEEQRLIFKELPPSPPPQPQNLIAIILNDIDTVELADILLEETPELVHRAKQILDRIPECREGVEKFSNVVLETWPLLADGISKALDPSNDLIGLVLRYANRDSATQRWASMKADPSLPSSLAAATSEIDILRLFLSILIGYWGDNAELPKLDDLMGRYDAFGIWIYIIENEQKRRKGKSPPEKPVKDAENRVKIFTYKIKDAEDAKNVERVREWLETEYAHYENVDVDDLFDKIESEILSHVKTDEECGHFNGSTVDIRIIQPWSFLVSVY